MPAPTAAYFHAQLTANIQAFLDGEISQETYDAVRKRIWDDVDAARMRDAVFRIIRGELPDFVSDYARV